MSVVIILHCSPMKMHHLENRCFSNQDFTNFLDTQANENYTMRFTNILWIWWYDFYLLEQAFSKNKLFRMPSALEFACVCKCSFQMNSLAKSCNWLTIRSNNCNKRTGKIWQGRQNHMKYQPTIFCGFSQMEFMHLRRHSRQRILSPWTTDDS